MYCSECRFFSDLGRCRNGAARRSDVGFFQKACDKFLPPPQEANQEPTKQTQPMEKETKTAQAETEAPKTKTCRECGRELPLDQFGKNRWGYTNLCKDCMTAKKAGKAPAAQEGPKPQPKEEKPAAATPAASTAKPKRNYLHYVSDEQLVAELKRRGYKGTIEMKKQFNIEA